MRRRRVVLTLALALGLLALAVCRPWRGGPANFATPADCLDALREASAAGDVERYLNCLGEPLRSQKQRSLSPADLRRDMEGVKSWSQLEPDVQGTTATVEVDRARASGTSRTRFRLERSGGGWLVVGMDRPQEITPPVRYGTHVSEAPD
jgi:hypothetical protein